MNLEHLKNRISEYNDKYRKGNPIISDAEYDILLSNIQCNLSEEEFLEFKKSLTEEKGNVFLNYIVGSLTKFKYEESDELYKWIKKQNIKTLFGSEKIDGCSFVASYRCGNLILCSSRGDGQEGTDWTEKAKFILPARIPSDVHLDIRGEFTLEKDTFEKLGFKNKRNGTVGIMNSKEMHDATNLVQAYVYEVMNMEYGIKHQFDYIRNCGFKAPKTIEFSVITTDLHEMLKGFYEFYKAKSTYDIDGVVISDSNYVRENKFFPDGKVAFKINSEGVETEVIDIEWQVSRTRYLKPVLMVNPIEINGVTISRVTAYNAKYIIDNKIKIGTKIKIIRSGEVIPRIIEVINPK